MKKYALIFFVRGWGLVVPALLRLARDGEVDGAPEGEDGGNNVTVFKTIHNSREDALRAFLDRDRGYFLLDVENDKMMYDYDVEDELEAGA